MTGRTEKVLGYDVICCNYRSCIEDIVGWIKKERDSGRRKKCRWLACLNPHSYAVAQKDELFSVALKQSNWLIPDGVGIVFASKVLRGRIVERFTGSDVFYGVQEVLNESEGFKVFFLGSTEDVLAGIKAKMEKDYPNVRVVGTYSPPFKSVYSSAELDYMAKAINEVGPDVLWVGMTAPKQEKWIAEMFDRVDVSFIAAIGAVFDFYVGRVKRSHPIFQRLGLEWLPRLVQQPRRLWRRMFISAPIFIWHVFLAKIGFEVEKAR